MPSPDSQLSSSLVSPPVSSSGLLSPDVEFSGIGKMELFFATYLRHYMGVASAPMHRSMMRELEDRSVQYLCLEAGRSAAKSTIGSVAFGLFNICESFDDEMQLVSRSGGRTGTATKIMRRIKRELEENDVLTADYGITRGDTWGEEVIEVVRGDGHRIMLYCMGKHSSIRGSRGTVLIDDPQNSADCRSETVLAADEDWLLEDVLPVIIQDQRLIFIGTPMSPLALLETVKALPGFKVLSFPMESPPWSGISAWPAMHSDEFLALRLSQLGKRRYGAEYLCEPKVSGSPVFQTEWFQHFEPDSAEFRLHIAQTLIYRVTAMDCAESKQTQADYSWLLTLAVTEGIKPNIYLMDSRMGHWSTKEGAEQVFLVFGDQQQNRTCVESRVKAGVSGLGGDAMIEEIREREKLNSTWVNLVPIHQVKDKVTRAMSVQSICQEGRVFVNKFDPMHQKLLKELLMFTGSQNFHDDGVDTLVMALQDIKSRDFRAESRVDRNKPNVQLPQGYAGPIGRATYGRTN